MPAKLRRVLGLLLFGLTAFLLFVGFKSSSWMGKQALIPFSLIAIFPFGFGWFLIQGKKFFPDKEEPIQPPENNARDET